MIDNVVIDHERRITALEERVQTLVRELEKEKEYSLHLADRLYSLGDHYNRHLGY